MKMSVRKIIQISSTSQVDNNRLYVLCNDGTVWYYDYSYEKECWAWKQVEKIPGAA